MRGLIVEHLVKRFGDVRAVDDVSFVVEPGAFIPLLGPGGCGKTTTLRCITGFERPDGGRILVDGSRSRMLQRACSSLRTSTASAWCASPAPYGRT